MSKVVLITVPHLELENLRVNILRKRVKSYGTSRNPQNYSDSNSLL